MVVMIWPLFVLWLIVKPFAEREYRRHRIVTEALREVIERRRNRRRAQRNKKTNVKKPKKVISVIEEIVLIPASNRMEAVIQDSEN